MKKEKKKKDEKKRKKKKKDLAHRTKWHRLAFLQPLIRAAVAPHVMLAGGAARPGDGVHEIPTPPRMNLLQRKFVEKIIVLPPLFLFVFFYLFFLFFLFRSFDETEREVNQLQR